MLRVKTILGVFVVAVVLIACQKVFEPDVDEIEPFLVIEANLTTQPGPHTVLITTSAPFNQENTYQRINNALVYITEDNSRREYLHRVNNGVYQTDSSSDFRAKIGSSYVLSVILEDGTAFRSSPQTVIESPEILNSFVEYYQEIVLTENSYGEALEIPVDGMYVIGETRGILPANNYYFYKFEGYEQHRSYMRIGVIDYRLYHHRPLSGVYSDLSIGNADEYGNFEIRNQKLVFIEAKRLFNYVPPVHDTLQQYILGTSFQGLLFKLEQHSLTPDAYSFWNDARAQLEASGKLFDPVTPQLHGNMVCVSDSLTKVIGIFTASDVSEKYSYFYITERNWTYSKDIDSFPELHIDSVSYSVPEGWIFPPR